MVFKNRITADEIGVMNMLYTEPWSWAPRVHWSSSADGRCYRVERQFAKDRDTVQVLDAHAAKTLLVIYPLDKRRSYFLPKRIPG